MITSKCGKNFKNFNQSGGHSVHCLECCKIKKKELKEKRKKCIYCERKLLPTQQKYCSNSCKSKHIHTGKTISDDTKKKISKSMKGRKILWSGKISESLTGKKLSKAHKKKLKETHIGMLGKSHTAETIEKMKNSKLGLKNPMYGKKLSNSAKEKISKANTGKIVSDITRRKMRLNRILQMQKDMFSGNQVLPSYNKNAIAIIENKAKELGIIDIKHAENGGEFYIEDLGYWVDGYSKEKNIVIEYYEKWHNNQKGHDENRKNEIINFLNCEFIEIRE